MALVFALKATQCFDHTKKYVESLCQAPNQGLAQASNDGNLDLVYLFIEKGANNWNAVMIAAAEKGHTDLVHFFIEKGANDWHRGMMAATRGGHAYLVEFFKKKMIE